MTVLPQNEHVLLEECAYWVRRIFPKHSKWKTTFIAEDGSSWLRVIVEPVGPYVVGDATRVDLAIWRRTLDVYLVSDGAVFGDPINLNLVTDYQGVKV